MTWESVNEPYAAPPRLKAFRATRPFTVDEVDVVGGRAYLSGVNIDGDADLLGAYDEIEVDTSTIANVVLGGDGTPDLDVTQCELTSCDLSRARFVRLRQSRVTDCKLTGTDFSGVQIADVVFERCLLQLTQLRMAQLQRVRFLDCTLREVDAFELVAEDVAFDGTELDRVNIDRLRAKRVDLRGARALSFEAMGRLDGCLVGEDQLYALAHDLAFALGLGVERVPD